MLEVTLASEDHRHTGVIRGGNRLAVLHRSTWLDDGAHAGPGRDLHAVGVWKEAITGQHRAGRSRSGTVDGKLDRLHPAHLTGADPDRRAFVGDDDRVRADMLDHRPRELQVSEGRVIGSLRRDDARLTQRV